MIFEFDEPEVREAYLTLLWATDGSEPCVEDPEAYTENWTGRPIPNEVAERLCGGCHVREQCLAYAMLNEEETTILGGTTADERERRRNDDTK